MTVMRHLLAILLLPVVVTVVVPHWLMDAELPLAGALHAPPAVARGAHVLGALLFLAGGALFLWCVVLFARVGQGTLAPWDPTRRLVVAGPYRYVRNPMISAVAVVLAGEALLHRSPRLAAWLALFVALNQVYFLLVEEPGLERRFGAAYLRYRRAVPRWVPRRRAWRDEPPTTGAT
ncbi:MAG: methyltransferase family protein [Gemmatimonadaceae bacterium]